MEKDSTLPRQEITLPESSLWRRMPVVAGLLGVVALALSALLGAGGKQFYFSYLTAFVYWLTVALGGLFFVLVHYQARSGWSVVVRRLAEHAMGTLPLFAVLFLPIVLGRHELYHWTHADAVAHDPLLQHKSPYLNETFFLLRAVFYLVVWGVIALYYWRGSARQDSEGDLAITERLQRRAAPALVLFGITVFFYAFDWVMSLEPHWFSTIFGVYLFAGSAVAIYSWLILVAFLLQRGGVLQRVVTVEHYHDLGKLLFAFTVFWAYIGFSQFMLIWYANIPEETHWYDMRWHHGWQPLSIFLAVGHFFVPFFYLLPQPIKRNPNTLVLAALWMLFMHWVDVYWLVMPTLHHEQLRFSVLDVTCWLGVGALFLALFSRLLRGNALVPVRDPRLDESLAFENA